MRFMFTLSEDDRNYPFKLYGDQILRLVSASMAIARSQDPGGWSDEGVSYLAVPLIEGIISGIEGLGKDQNPYDVNKEGDSWKAWNSGWLDSSFYIPLTSEDNGSET